MILQKVDYLIFFSKKLLLAVEGMRRSGSYVILDMNTSKS